MNALAEFMEMMLLPSVPSLVIDLSAAVLTTTHAVFSDERGWVFSIEPEFSMADEEQSLGGHFLLMPDLPALQKILQAIRLA